MFHIEDRRDGRVGTRLLADSLSDGPCMDQAQMMRGRAEFVWLPSALITSSVARRERATRWRARGEWRAAMRYAGPLGPDSLVAQFDGHTRALTSLAGMRCRDDSRRHSWRVRFTEWDDPGGLMIPVAGDALWGDAAYYTFNVTGIRYNVPVDEWFEAPPEPSAP